MSTSCADFCQTRSHQDTTSTEDCQWTTGIGASQLHVLQPQHQLSIVQAQKGRVTNGGRGVFRATINLWRVGDVSSVGVNDVFRNVFPPTQDDDFTPCVRNM